MRVSAVDIRQPKAGNQHILNLDRGVKDALAAYARHCWPSNTAKFLAREWGLTLDEARGVVACRTSLATLDRIFKHPNGGWRVLLPVMGAVVGQSIEDFHKNEQKSHAEQARRHGALSRDLRLVGPSRDRAGRELDVRSSEEPRSFGRRLVIKTDRKAGEQ